jgi:hypothetical protein
MTYRLIPALAPVLLALLFGASVSAAPDLQASTPTPTPTPGPQNQPVSSFHVDNDAEPPWNVPIMPTWGTGTPQPTLHAATPPHATNYPDTVSTATAAIGVYVGPISAVSTPVAGLIGSGPTQTAGDVNTGLDPVGEGVITFAGFGASIHDNLVEVIGAAKVFVIDLIDLASYAPWLAPVPVVWIAATVISIFLPMIAIIVKAATWLLNLLMKIATIASAIKIIAKIWG